MIADNSPVSQTAPTVPEIKMTERHIDLLAWAEADREWSPGAKQKFYEIAAFLRPIVSNQRVVVEREKLANIASSAETILGAKTLNPSRLLRNHALYIRDTVRRWLSAMESK
jgi:hypothetical protein